MKLCMNCLALQGILALAPITAPRRRCPGRRRKAPLSLQESSLEPGWRGSPNTASPTDCASCSSRIPGKPTITVNITYLVGSRHENYGETGMAHLLEHMLFKGTPRHPDIPKELTERGARSNGQTSFDRTNYFETFQATDENLRWALDLEADRMLHSLAVGPRASPPGIGWEPR